MTKILQSMNLSWTLTLLAVSWILASATPGYAELTVGSKAPALNIEHWISNGDGHFKPVTEFEKDKVYIVEFWATWCGPCIASMPHLAELQKANKNKNVQIISVSDEDLETVQHFLHRAVPTGMIAALRKYSPLSPAPQVASEPVEDSPKMTFGELTSAWCLTTDPDRSVYQDYMEAAGENGIPTAFIIGKQGIIEWIGQPADMDEPLSQILDDQWDRQAFRDERAKLKEIDRSLMEIYGLMQDGKADEALKGLEHLIQKHQGTEFSWGLQSLRIDLLIQMDPEKATKTLKDVGAEVDDAEILNMLAWNIVQSDSDDGSDLPEGLLAAAVAIAEKATNLSPQDGSILDTLARLVHMQGNLDRALELQTKAVELTPEIDELKEFLEQLKAEKEEAK